MINNFVLESNYSLSHEKIKELNVLLRNCVEKMSQDFSSFTIDDIRSFSDFLTARDHLLVNATHRNFEDIAFLDIGIIAKLNVLFAISNFSIKLWKKFVFETLWDIFIFEFTSEIKFRNMSYVIKKISERYFR